MSRPNDLRYTSGVPDRLRTTLRARHAPTSLLQTMKALGYEAGVALVGCKLEVALRRNKNRSEKEISCYYAKPYHCAWIMGAVQTALAAAN
jgi:hypothetical protein